MAQIQGFDRVVANMMTRYGTQCYLVSVNQSGGYNPDTSEFVANLSKSYKINVIFTDFPLRKDGTRLIGGSLMDEADKMAYVQPYKDVPLPKIDPAKDKLKVGNEYWRILGVKEENPTLSESIVLILYIKR